MSNSLRTETVADLSKRGILRVEDGNHGEYRPRNDEFAQQGVAFVRAADIVGNRIDFAGADHINANAYERIRKGIGAPGDIIFSHKGTVGKLALVEDSAPPFVCSPQTTFWRVLDHSAINSVFLYFFMQSRAFENQWKAVAGETDMADYVSLTNQRRLKLFLPPIDEQKAIASILGSLDDKIDLNRRMNETLESMARALYKSWFVDFDPVVAKAAGKRPFGMDDATAALFPDRFVESELGPIPEGWEASTLGEHFRITMGQSPPGDTYNEEENGLPFYQGRRDFGDRYPSRRIYCSVPKRMAEPADTLVTVRAPVGDINMALEKCAIGRGVAAVRHTSDSRTFTFYTMQEMDREFEVYRGEGTLFGAINKGGFEELAFVAPPAGILSAYEEKASPMDDLIESNYSESQTLTHLRDLLLPKLLSGEIHIKDAEKVVQEVS